MEDNLKKDIENLKKRVAVLEQDKINHRKNKIKLLIALSILSFLLIIAYFIIMNYIISQMTSVLQ